MGKRSPKVDAYIEKSAGFARPILKKLRQQMHKASPKIEETIKWSAPHFEYKGIVAGMVAFKQHVSFGFWKGGLMKDPKGLFEKAGSTSITTMRVKELSDLPSDKVLLSYIKEAVKLNEEGVKVPAAPKKKGKKAETKAPPDLMKALKKSKKALATFEGFPPSHRKEYVEWIVEAKQEATRERRIATAVEWMSEAKPKNWKYMKKK